MASYEYRGKNAQGEIVSGRLEASDSDGVATELLQREITPLEISLVSAIPNLKALLNQNIAEGHVPLQDLITFCRQMYTLTKAGVTITQAIEHLYDVTRSQMLVDALHGIVDHVSAGQKFTAALKKYPKVFPPVFVSITDAGENSGQLENAFKQLSAYLELELKTRNRVKAATRYPIMVIVAVTIALIVINFLVVPSFATLFKGMGGELPLPTKILMGTSQFFINYWYFILLGIIAAVIVIRMLIKQKAGRYVWDKYKLKVPIFGSIINRVILARFSRTFAMVMQTGVPLVQGVDLVSSVVGNKFISGKVDEMRENISRGETLTHAARATQMFPPLVIQMLSVGEESGSIDAMFQEVAEFYEEEVDYDLKRLSDLIEPFLLLIMGAMILILALGVFLPMWDMVQLM